MAKLKLCPYHQDNLGWDDCSEGFEGCEIEKARAAAPMTNKEYVEDEGAKCPVCKSTQIEGDAIDISGKNAYQPCGCNDCGASWMSEYVLTGYAELEKE